MNYRHLFHAGNFTEVVKHTVLIELLRYLQQKPTPYCFIDTHAGEGRYDLTTVVTQKTPEASQGIARLLSAKAHPDFLQDYIALESMKDYLGSPLLAAKLSRPMDQIILNEKHPDTYHALKKNMRDYPNVAVHQRDAYELLPAIIPPASRRGLVLIDPAFEDPNEMAHINECLTKCAKRWPQGMYLVWLPIVGRKYYDSRDLTHTGFEKFLTIEFYVRSNTSDVEGLIGCSLLFINPPWQIETTLTPLLAYLWEVLHIDADSTWSIQI